MKKIVLNTLAVISFMGLLCVGLAKGFGLWMIPVGLLSAMYLGVFCYANYVKR